MKLIDALQPNSYSEELSRFTNVNNANQEARLRDIAAQRIQAKQAGMDKLASIYASGRSPTTNEYGTVNPEGAQDYQSNDISEQAKRYTAMKMAATDIVSKVEQTGIKPGDPLFQAKVNEIGNPYRDFMSKLSGKPVNNDDIHYESLKAIADYTPSEKAQMERNAKIQGLQDEQPFKLELENAKHSGDLGKEARKFQYDMQLQERKGEMDIAREERKAQEILNRPLPPQIMKTVKESLDNITNAKGLAADVNGIINQIDSKKLNFGLVSNATNYLKQKTGNSDEGSRLYDQYNSQIEKIRNTVLNMAKGPQTDGDAERAINELVKNPTDPENVKLQMGRIKASLDRTARNESLAIDTMRENYGKGPMDKSAYENQQSTTEIPQETGYEYKVEGGKLLRRKVGQ